MEELLECPNCGCSWGFDEIQWQICHACGYPNHDEFEYQETFEEEEEEED